MNHEKLITYNEMRILCMSSPKIDNPCEMDLLIKLLQSGDSKNENHISNNIISESRAKEINESYQNLRDTANSSNINSGIEE